jgi:signal transduction histidine kinase
VVAVVFAVIVGGTATEATHVVGSDYADVNDMVGLAACLTLFWRRRWPVPVALLTFVAAAAAPMAGGAAIAALFTVAAVNPGRTPYVIGAVALVSGAINAIVFPDRSISTWLNVLLALLFVVAAVGWGLVVRARAERLSALLERAERVEAEQQARLAEARRAERATIAAEMHDVLAHRLSMLSLHAGAIELHPDAPPEDLVNAARVVRSSAHQAIEELRVVMGVLRDDGAAAESASLTPAPTITDVDALVAECRQVGMQVQLTLPAELRDAPAEVGRHVYRIVQEALTNARKHARGAPVTVALGGGPGRGLSIEVVNELAPTGPASAVPGAGLGLVGLRERVELLRGRLTATRDGGLHRLDAWLPWPA